MYHNAGNMRIKSEVEQLKQIYAQNPASLKNIAPEILAALVANNQTELEKIVGKKVKELLDKQKAD